MAVDNVAAVDFTHMSMHTVDNRPIVVGKIGIVADCYCTIGVTARTDVLAVLVHKVAHIGVVFVMNVTAVFANLIVSGTVLRN